MAEINKELWEEATELERFFIHMIKNAVQNPIQLTEKDVECFEVSCVNYVALFETWKKKVLKQANAGVIKNGT